MKNTKNYNLQKPDFNNVVDIEVLNDNFDKIDTGITPFYVATLNSTNIYEVATGLSITKLNDGFSVRIAIPSDSTGAVSIIIDTCNAVPVKKPNGNAVTNFKANGVYSLTYYNSVFILASGGVDDVNFSASDLLSGKTANNSDGEKVTGTMPNIGQQTATINAGGKVTISKGYHDGTGYIQSNSMSTQLTNLGVTLTSASQLVKDVKAVDKNGSLITGTYNPNIVYTYSGSITIPSKYDGGKAIVKVAGTPKLAEYNFYAKGQQVNDKHLNNFITGTHLYDYNRSHCNAFSYSGEMRFSNNNTFEVEVTYNIYAW